MENLWQKIVVNALHYWTIFASEIWGKTFNHGRWLVPITLMQKTDIQYTVISIKFALIRIISIKFEFSSESQLATFAVKS